MINLTIYYDSENQASVKTLDDVNALRQTLVFSITKIDVSVDRALYQRIKQTPIIRVGPYTLQGDITRQQIQVAINAANDRDKNLRMLGDKGYEGKINRGKKLSGSDRLTLMISKHYMLLFNLVMALYVGLPFLAPVMMHNGLTFPAAIIYKIYRPLCHQLTFRSFFLYGEQPYYPRALANVPDVLSYEEYFHQDPVNLNFAREFTGDQVTGYKVALCERDIGIYGSFLLFGILFHLTGKKMPKIPWYIWILFGIIPIGLDGTSQLPGLISSVLPSWVPIRESTPVLRLLTGAMFGITTAWYLYPMVEETMKDARILLTQKKNYVEQNVPE